jgi:hypothetical protein
MLAISGIGRRKDCLEASGRPPVLGVGQNVEDSTREIHDSEAMLKALVRGCGIDQPRQRELVNVTESLKRPRIDDLSLIGGKHDEPMDRITEFVVFLRHEIMVAAALR